MPLFLSDGSIAYVTPLQYEGGIPYYWRNDTSGQMYRVMGAFSLWLITPNSSMTIGDKMTLRSYLSHVINAPCWKVEAEQAAEFAALKERVFKLDRREDFSQWLWDALHFGIDAM